MATTFDRGTAATFATAAPADQKGTDLNNTILHIRYILFSFRKPEREDLRAQINK
jgi:hypothetical protein